MFKHSKTLFIGILSAALLLGLSPAKAAAVTQEEIASVRAQRDAISAVRAEQQAAVEALNRQQAGVLEQKAAMDARSAATLEQIELTQQEIALYGALVEQTRGEVEQAAAREQEQLARYRSRVRAMEENGRSDLLSLILHTASLGEFFTAADDIGEIMRYDRELENAYRDAREQRELLQAEYEQAQTALVARQAELVIQQTELQAEIDEAAALILSLQGEIESSQAALDEVLAAEARADAELNRLMAELERARREEEERRRREEERRRQEEERLRQEQEQQEQARREQEAQQQAQRSPTLATAANATGSFLWPVPGHTYITSRFGLRIHPVTGREKKHTGLDISADHGTPIVASDGGRVTKAAVYSGYGNCVILDHGNGYVTLYGHMSRISVSEGEQVRQGQTIGLVGSTGVSTGPHCHFEIWSGGERIDPENFFTGLSFSENAGE